MMRLACRLGWHEYDKWTDQGTIKTLVHDWTRPSRTPLNEALVERTDQVQARRCAHCGIVTIRRERI